ncbi:MAG: site-specific integrase, partial [Maritimibacter sp.]
MRLYDGVRRRLERSRFARIAEAQRPDVASLCLTLLYTGCRLSEALAPTPGAIRPEARTVTFRTLKRRNPQVFREVPVPPLLIELFAQAHDLSGPPDLPLWNIRGSALNRVTAYRWVKVVMLEAGISGAQACPKGLRHGYQADAP